MARADLHFHLLPGVDDGPATFDESVELARAAEREGTTAILATPHVRVDFVTDVEGLPHLAAAVRARLEQEEIGVRVWCGAELGHDMVGRLCQQELETIAQGPRTRAGCCSRRPSRISPAPSPARRPSCATAASPWCSPTRSEARASSASTRMHFARSSIAEPSCRSTHRRSRADTAGRRRSWQSGSWSPGSLSSSPPTRTPSTGALPLRAAFDAALACGIGGPTARRLTDLAPARLLYTGLAVPAAA